MELSQLIYIIFFFVLVLILIKGMKMLIIFIKLSKKTKYVEPDIKFRYSKNEIPEKIDFIVIGAGTSGLTSAAVLSKLGYKVLVLEKIGKAGGCMHTFKKEGFEFDTGFHYIGNEPGIKLLFKFVTSKKINWNIFKHYDTVHLGNDKKHEFKAPTKKFYSDLLEKFPEDKEAILKYKSYSKQAVKLLQLTTIQNFLPRIFNFFLQIYIYKKFSQVYEKSVLQVFDEIGISKNRELSYLLNITPSGGIGSNSEKMPFVAHAAYIYHFNQAGSMYPVGGPRSIVESMVSTIVQNGGKLLTKAPVQNIIIEQNQVIGVQMAGETVIKCKNVISTVGYMTTSKLVPVIYKNEFSSVKYNNNNGFTNFSMFYGLNLKDLPKDQIPQGENTWYMPKYDPKITFDKFLENYEQSGNLKDMWTYISFPSLKSDSSSTEVSVCQLGNATREQVDKYQKSEKQRNEGYAEYKEEVMEEMQKQFLEKYPQFKDRIVHKLLGTPLTIENYFGRRLPYGLQVTTEKIFDTNHFMKTNTSVYGLFLSGQDTMMGGIVGSMIMGYITALRSTGYI